MKLTPRERFLAKVCPEPESGCWLWRGVAIASGYGTVRFEGKIYLAHRFAWKLFRGEIAPGLAVCHKCDVRNCVNPDHLFLGTWLDNMKDMAAKGRSTRGERHPASRLTQEQVSRIKTLLSEGRMYMTEIAREFDVAHSTISSIKRGQTWQHVQAAPVSVEGEAADETTPESIGCEDDL